MATATTTNLLTVAKLADAWGVPKAKLAKRIKEEKIAPDRIKAGCSYYDAARLAAFKAKLTS